MLAIGYLKQLLTLLLGCLCRAVEPTTNSAVGPLKFVLPVCLKFTFEVSTTGVCKIYKLVSCVVSAVGQLKQLLIGQLGSCKIIWFLQPTYDRLTD